MKHLLDGEKLIETLNKQGISNDTPFSYDSLTTIEDTRSLIDSVTQHKKPTVYILSIKTLWTDNRIDSAYSSKEKAWERIEKLFNSGMNIIKHDKRITILTMFGPDSFRFIYGSPEWYYEYTVYTITKCVLDVY